MLNITGIPFSFKNEGLDVNKLREKRSEKAVKLRKKKRDVSFDHQRDLNDFRAENMNSLIEIEYILQNGEKGHGEKFYAIKSFSTECKCHPEDVAKSGVAKVVLDFLDTQKSNPTMQNEILICFINATCWLKELPGKTFTENHGIESCMQILISTPYNDVRDNAIVLLDNIVQTSNAYRDKVLDFGILAHLLSLLQTSNCRDIQMNGVELLAHLSDEFFATDPRMISFKCCFPLLAKYLHHKDPKVLEFTMKTLSNLSLEIFFDEFIDGGFCPRLMQILDSKPPLDVIHSALNCIQSLTNEKNAMSQIFVSLNLLGVISKILRSPKDCYQKNFFEKKSTTGLIVSACYAVGNILQADPKYIQLIIESEIFPPIIEHMHEGEFKVKRSAVCVLSHARELNHQQIEYLASIGCIAPLCDLLTIGDQNLKKLILQIIRQLLWHADETSLQMVVNGIEECGGVEKIEELQYNNNDVLGDIARDIIIWFFDGRNSNDVSMEMESIGTEMDFMDSGYGLSLANSRFEF